MKTCKKVELRATKIAGNNIPVFGPVKNSGDGHKYAAHFWGDDLEIYESFFILMLDRSNTPIAWAKISQGGVSGTVVDPKIVAKYCVDTLCSAVIFAHNHPGGSLRPSDADRNLTTRMKNALELLDIQVLDHLILTAKGFYSFADNGQI